MVVITLVAAIIIFALASLLAVVLTSTVGLTPVEAWALVSLIPGVLVILAAARSRRTEADDAC